LGLYTERAKGLRRALLAALPGPDVTRFKFVDQPSVHLTCTRRYGRAAGGRRVDQAGPRRNDPDVTVAAALTPQGLGAVMALGGAVNTARFAAYVEQALGPTRVAGDLVVLDNLRGHKELARAQSARPGRGRRRLRRPPAV
ncbi:transposase, partial [Hymenobacter coccineus]